MSHFYMCVRDGMCVRRHVCLSVIALARLERERGVCGGGCIYLGS